jgi:hypothetical protein
MPREKGRIHSPIETGQSGETEPRIPQSQADIVDPLLSNVARSKAVDTR